MRNIDPNYDEDLASWLQEVGRRKACGSPSLPASAGEIAASLPAGPAMPQILERAKRPLLLTIAAIAYLQYFYAGVMFKILSLQSIIFFVAAGG
jgi:hypothetical protein